MTLFNKTRAQRVALIAGGMLLLSLAAALILNAFRSNMVFFFSPTQVIAGENPRDKVFRLGGMVERGSVHRASDGLQAQFVLTDTVNRIEVVYQGVLPDLFGEDQGAVALGRMQGERFVAEQVLAKHDENYMPPEVASALKVAGATQSGDKK